MDTRTGRVISEEEHNALPEGEQRNWTKFEIGEQIDVKGVRFTVHDVSDQRLVLKFKAR